LGGTVEACGVTVRADVSMYGVSYGMSDAFSLMVR
jgi:hypothetical protein